MNHHLKYEYLICGIVIEKLERVFETKVNPRAIEKKADRMPEQKKKYLTQNKKNPSPRRILFDKTFLPIFGTSPCLPYVSHNNYNCFTTSDKEISKIAEREI